MTNNNTFKTQLKLSSPIKPVRELRRAQIASTALLAAFSNVGSPRSRLKAPNSSRSEPAPAVAVWVIVSFGTPN